MGIVKALTDALNNALTAVCSIALLSAALVMAGVVMLRYVFGVGALWFQDLALYAHAAVVLLPAGSVLAVNRHVRVDVVMSGADVRLRAAIDLCGCVLFLLPFCAVMIFKGLPFALASWAILEGSPQPSGLQGVFLLKTGLVVGAVLLALQGIVLALEAVQTMATRPSIAEGRR